MPYSTARKDISHLMEIKGGKESGQETLYERIGKLIGSQESLHKSIEEINKSLTRLWEKFDTRKTISHEQAKEMLNEHGDICPLKAKVELIEEEKDKKSVSFRWFVSITLTIITIIVSIIAAIGLLK